MHARQKTTPLQWRPGWGLASTLVALDALAQRGVDADSPPRAPRAQASGEGRTRLPSENRLNRNGAGSTTGGSPITNSAIRRPAPGAIPNPCPVNPVAMKNPGSVSTPEITGSPSGVTSIIPPQLSATRIV
jgi:hypothetical protein